MHIAFLNPQGNFDPDDSYWTEHPDFGGQLVYVKEVALELALLGHEVDILTRKIEDPEWPEFSASLDSYSKPNSPRIIRIPCGPAGFLPKEELWPYLITEWVPNITAFYQEEGRTVDIYTAHYGDGGLAGAALQQDRGTPFTFTAHSLGAQKMDKLGANAQTIAALENRYHFTSRIAAERVAMNHAARIITSTQQERDTQYGHAAYQGAIDRPSRDVFSVIPPGVNLEVFSQTSTDLDKHIASRIEHICEQALLPERRHLPFILSASRLDPKKNLLGLINAFGLDDVLQQKANVLLAVRSPLEDFNQKSVFNDPDNQVLQQINLAIKEHKLEGKVVAIPLNNQLELAAGYRVAKKRGSVFVLPALYEPFGLAPLEAMACGLPAVVTKNGGPTESMIEDSQEFGILVDPESPADIARGLLRLLGSEKEWKTFQQAAVFRVQDRYTWTKTAKGYELVFQEILQRG
ncbi:MAG: glycosyltransferase, partial [Anaerolineales bacterium]